jgi:predicted NBD/HSP70 family sugar kinase
MFDFYIIDIGGTKIECMSLLRGHSSLYNLSTPNSGSFMIDMSIIKSWINSIAKKENINVAVSFAGIIKNDFIVKWPNRVYWENNNLIKYLKLAFKTSRICIYEDCNMGSLANSYLSPTSENSIYVNVGTGIGMGIIIARKIYKGDLGFAGELGHTVVNCITEEKCECGKSGCLQLFSSGRGMLRQLKNLQADSLCINTVDDFSNFEHVPEIAKIITHGAELLGIVLSNLVCIFDITCLHIGGSVLNNHLFRKTLVNKILELEEVFLKRNINIIISPFKNASLIGTLIMATDYYNLSEEQYKFVTNIIENQKRVT